MFVNMARLRLKWKWMAQRWWEATDGEGPRAEVFTQPHRAAWVP
jgi:hypothetical protein